MRKCDLSLSATWQLHSLRKLETVPPLWSDRWLVVCFGKSLQQSFGLVRRSRTECLDNVIHNDLRYTKTTVVKDPHDKISLMAFLTLQMRFVVSGFDLCLGMFRARFLPRQKREWCIMNASSPSKLYPSVKNDSSEMFTRQIPSNNHAWGWECWTSFHEIVFSFSVTSP